MNFFLGVLTGVVLSAIIAIVAAFFVDEIQIERIDG